MSSGDERLQDLRVLANKRDATRYRILVEIAERQPAVNQPEIADSLGITSQAVSQYLSDLVEQGHVQKLGRGRYEITNEGVDWIISQTEELGDFVRYVSEEVIEETGVEAAIAAEPISAGEEVSLQMDAGTLVASPGGEASGRATAVTDADAGQDVGLIDFEGLLEFDVGEVEVIEVPAVQDGGSTKTDVDLVADRAAAADRVAVSGTEALAAANRAGVEADMQFGTPQAVQQAALKGLDILLLTTGPNRSRHTDRLREFDIAFDVLEG